MFSFLRSVFISQEQFLLYVIAKPWDLLDAQISREVHSLFLFSSLLQGFIFFDGRTRRDWTDHCGKCKPLCHFESFFPSATC